MNSDCDASASGQLMPHDRQLLAKALGLAISQQFLARELLRLRDGIDGCVRSHSSCNRWRAHHFQACFHKARSRQCPHQEDRRKQAYDGEETRVTWTLAAASGCLFISVHDPHSIKIFEGQHFQVPTTIHSCIDPCQFHRKSSRRTSHPRAGAARRRRGRGDGKTLQA